LYRELSLRWLSMVFVMPITAVDEDGQGQHFASSDKDIDFSFIPKVLIEYSKTFIATYHKLSGFSSLPDILWHPETRKFIEADLASSKDRRRRVARKGRTEASC
jgi:hypothetical protein